MSYDGSGNYTLPAGAIQVDGTQIDAADVNTPFNDFATAFGLAFLHDGRKAATGDFDLNSHKIENLAPGTAATDAATVGQLTTSASQQASSVGGTVDAITLTFSPQFTSYTSGMYIRWTSGGPNTVTAPTVNVSTLGNKTLKKEDSQALLAGDTGPSGYQCEAVYNGTDLILMNPYMDIATAAEFRANTSRKILETDKVWSAAAEVTLTDAATIAVDMSTFINAIVTLGGNRTLGQPSNTKVGQAGCIRIVQDGTGSRTLAYHADWKFAGGTDPVLTTTAGATDLLFYQVIATNFIFASLVKGVA